jgi:RNA polymerase-binding transcription factor DksA
MNRERAQELLTARRRSVRRMAAAGQRALEGDARSDIFGGLSGTDQHQADSASETYELERDTTILRIAHEEQADIEHALRKLATGAYGVCETCNAAIPDDRLEARPEARFCEEHERAWELGTIAFDLPDAGPSVDDPFEPGWRELQDLPADDGLVPDPPLAAEEAALHEEPPDGWLSADAIEEAEERYAAELAREEERRASDENRERTDLDGVEHDEGQLGP